MAIYYIDYKNGDDVTGTGATDVPWKTIVKGFASIASGDTLRLRGGDVLNEHHFTGIATLAWKNGVTIMADTGHSPVIRTAGAHESAEWTLTVGRASTYEHVQAGTVQQAFSGISPSSLLVKVTSIDEVEATAGTWYQAGDVIYVHVVGDGVPVCIFEMITVDAAIRLQCTGTIIDGLTFKWCMGSVVPINNGGAQTNTVQNVTLQYCYAWGKGQIIGYKNLVVANIKASNIYKSVIYTGAGSVSTICSNIQLSVGQSVIWHAFGDLVGNGISGSGQIYTDDGTTWTLTNIVAYNVSNNQLELRGTGTISRFCVYLTPALSDSIEVKGIIFHGAGAKNAYHGVVYNLRGTALGDGEGYYFGTDDTATVKNCAVVGCKIGFRVPVTSFPTLVLDYNALYDNTTNFSNVAVGDQGTHNITDAPRFANAEAYDFRLMHSSPCIDAGVLVAGVNEGFRGGAPDIGAHEYVRPLVHHRRR